MLTYQLKLVHKGQLVFCSPRSMGGGRWARDHKQPEWTPHTYNRTDHSAFGSQEYPFILEKPVLVLVPRDLMKLCLGSSELFSSSFYVNRKCYLPPAAIAN